MRSALIFGAGTTGSKAKTAESTAGRSGRSIAEITESSGVATAAMNVSNGAMIAAANVCSRAAVELGSIEMTVKGLTELTAAAMEEDGLTKRNAVDSIAKIVEQDSTGAVGIAISAGISAGVETTADLTGTSTAKTEVGRAATAVGGGVPTGGRSAVRNALRFGMNERNRRLGTGSGAMTTVRGTAA